MKTLLLLLFMIPGAFAFEGEYVLSREIPLVRLPVCKTWIPEGRVWGCVHVERRDMADRATIEALIQEIIELKRRVKDLEDQM